MSVDVDKPYADLASSTGHQREGTGCHATNRLRPPAAGPGLLGLWLVGGILAHRNILSRPAGNALAVAGPAFIFVTVLPAGFEAVMGGAVFWLGLRFVQELTQPAPAPSIQAVPS